MGILGNPFLCVKFCLVNHVPSQQRPECQPPRCPLFRQEIRNPYLVKTRSAHPHLNAAYDARGVQTKGGLVVLVQEEFCSGGSLQDRLEVLLRGAGGRSSGRRTAGGDSGGGKGDGSLFGVGEEERARASGDSCSGLGPFTPGGDATDAKPSQAQAGGPRGGAATVAARLEVWVRQVKRSPVMNTAETATTLKQSSLSCREAD